MRTRLFHFEVIAMVYMEINTGHLFLEILSEFEKSTLKSTTFGNFLFSLEVFDL